MTKCNIEGGAEESTPKGNGHLSRSRSNACGEMNTTDLPQGDLKGMKEAVESPLNMCPLIKMEYVY